MRAKLVKIGNSRGIRLPKAVIEEAQLGDEVELTIRKGEVVIARVKAVREGWAEAALHMAQHETYEDDDEFEDHLPDEDWSDFWEKFDK